MYARRGSRLSEDYPPSVYLTNSCPDPLAWCGLEVCSTMITPLSAWVATHLARAWFRGCRSAQVVDHYLPIKCLRLDWQPYHSRVREFKAPATSQAPEASAQSPYSAHPVNIRRNTTLSPDRVLIREEGHCTGACLSSRPWPVATTSRSDCRRLEECPAVGVSLVPDKSRLI